MSGSARDRSMFGPPHIDAAFDRQGQRARPIEISYNTAGNVTGADEPTGQMRPGIASDHPVSRSRPEPNIGQNLDDMPGVAGFRFFELPLNDDGTVDEDALVPGAVYRIPDSAGGGTGQWKSGAFYNFDREADWDIRSSGDLDAYSGASDTPTPEERSEELDKTLMPAERLDAAGIEAFREKSGYGLARSDDGYTLTGPSGQELFDLTDEDAAELARQWTPEIAKQVQTIGLVWRADLTPAEKRRLFADAIGADESLDERIPSGRAYGRWVAQSPKRALAHKRLKAFDALAEAMEREASDEEIGALLGEFHAAMLPEVLGTGRFVRELMMDLAPGLGNIRSARHLQNDIDEVEEAIETGDWSDAALASGMAILDFIGILPGGNLVNAGGKLAGRGMVRAVPHLDGLLAERTIRRFKGQWDKKVNKIDPRRFVGQLFDELDSKVRNKFRGLVNNRVGHLSENEVFDIILRMDEDAEDQIIKELRDGLPTRRRIHDYKAQYLSEIIEIRNAALGRFARWVAGAADRGIPGVLGKIRRVELKTGNARKSSGQNAADKEIGDVLNLRRDPEEVSINFVIQDLSEFLNKWVADGRIDLPTAQALKDAMARTKAKGIVKVKFIEYVDLLARLGAGTARRTETDRDDVLPAISPYQP